MAVKGRENSVCTRHIKLDRSTMKMFYINIFDIDLNSTNVLLGYSYMRYFLK